MSVQGPNPPAAAATSNANGGTLDWASPGNAKAEDGAVARAGDGASSGTSYRLILTNLGFAGLSGSVDGILVEVKKAGSSLLAVTDAEVYLTADGSHPAGSNKADLAAGWPTTLGFASYGGSADAWSAGLTAIDVMGTGFGIILAATLGTGALADVDFVRVTVNYTPGTGATLCQVRVVRPPDCPGFWDE